MNNTKHLQDVTIGSCFQKTSFRVLTIHYSLINALNCASKGILVPLTGLDGLCPSFASALRTPDYVRLRRGGSSPAFSYNTKKENPHKSVDSLFGAADRTWTGTVLPPRDFKSLASAYSATAANSLFGGATQIWTGGGGFAGPCLTTWLWRHFFIEKIHNKKNGAGNEIRTRDICLGKATLYHWATPARHNVLF